MLGVGDAWILSSISMALEVLELRVLVPLREEEMRTECQRCIVCLSPSHTYANALTYCPQENKWEVELSRESYKKGLSFLYFYHTTDLENSNSTLVHLHHPSYCFHIWCLSLSVLTALQGEPLLTSRKYDATELREAKRFTCSLTAIELRQCSRVSDPDSCTFYNMTPCSE